MANLRDQANRKIKIAEQTFNYIITHPIIGNKDINHKIAFEALENQKQMEYINFREKSLFIQRFANYICRFYLPNAEHNNKLITIRVGNEKETYAFRSTFLLLFDDIWNRRFFITDMKK